MGNESKVDCGNFRARWNSQDAAVEVLDVFHVKHAVSYNNHIMLLLLKSAGQLALTLLDSLRRPLNGWQVSTK